MLLSVFYYCICAFLCCCGSFNPSLCPFVAISSVLPGCHHFKAMSFDGILPLQGLLTL